MSAAEINLLFEVYRNDVIRVRTVWQNGVHTLELDDCKRGSRPTMASTPDVKMCVEYAVLKNGSSTIGELRHNVCRTECLSR